MTKTIAAFLVLALSSTVVLADGMVAEDSTIISVKNVADLTAAPVPSAIVSDSSALVTVANVCSGAVLNNTQAERCWEANGSSSKQFGSEGGSDGESGESTE